MVNQPVIVKEVYSYHVPRDIEGQPYDKMQARYMTGDSPYIEYKNVAYLRAIWNPEKRSWEQRHINEDNLKKYFTLYYMGQNEEGEALFKAVCKDEINVQTIGFKGHLRLDPVEDIYDKYETLFIDYETRIK